MSDKLHPEIIKHLPHLRAFALMLTRERTLADDLVQETVVRALSHADQFQPGSNFKAWVSTILRNSFFNDSAIAVASPSSISASLTRSRPPAAARRSSSTFATSSALSRH